MDQVWYSPRLSEAIINSEIIFDETQSITTDIVSGHLDIQQLVANMEGVLTNTNIEHREKGMIFFTKVLKELPKRYLSEMQIHFISKFYVDRLNDNHRVVPAVIDGYLAIVQMRNFKMEWSGEFFRVLFKEVTCQSQLRHDRYNIYMIVQQVMMRDLEYVKTLGPDFVYGVISCIEGERDPRNLMFLFTMLPTFIKNVPLGHLTEEMFDVVACYFPIDFNPVSQDPTAVSRADLVNALYPCLCAIKEFGAQCMLLVLDKLETSLRTAKIDSFELLSKSCKVFEPCVYSAFLKKLWSLIHTEIMHKMDEEIRAAAHTALCSLVVLLSSEANTNQDFENFLKAIIITMQREISEASTVSHFTMATKVIITAANATKESCILITKIMVPSAVAYFEFRTTDKLQIASLEFLAELYEMMKHWDVVDEIGDHISEIPGLCLKATSHTEKDYQIVGLKTLLKTIDILKPEYVLPFVEILVSFVQKSKDDELLKLSIKTIHAIARKYPEMIMDYVVKGKFDVNELTEDKATLRKRARLLSNLASIDDFTNIILEQMLKMMVTHDQDAGQVVEALSECVIDKTLYPETKVVEIESDHGLIETAIEWLYIEKREHNRECMDGFALVDRLISNLPAEKQKSVVLKYTQRALQACNEDDYYFHLLDALYGPLRPSECGICPESVIHLGITMALKEPINLRVSGVKLISLLLNKADFGKAFEGIYETVKSHMESLIPENGTDKSRLLVLSGWVAKALVMRGSDLYKEWFHKVLKHINDHERCRDVSTVVKLMMADLTYTLTTKQHCRVSPVYKQRVFLEFYRFTQEIDVQALDDRVKENYYLSWANILGSTPKSAYMAEMDKISRIIVDSLIYNNSHILLTMMTLMSHLLDIQHPLLMGSLQSILPRFVSLSQCKTSMTIRIASLRFLAHLANMYPTSALLPYRQDMLIGLAPALDDKKRLVRDVAVKARTRWFMVGAPGETKKNAV